MTTLLQTLYDEHRSIAAVLHGMQYLVREHRDKGKRVDPRVFRAMLYYLDVFPEREHHPKEEQFLFAALRRRTRDADEILDALKAEHEGGERAIRALEQDLVRYEAGGDAEFPAFAEAVEGFVEGYWAHMRKEEQQVMPIAKAKLTAEDWVEIEHAFAANRDPLKGTDHTQEFRELFSKIVNLAPAPIGLGPGG